MAIDTSGEYWIGSEAADLDAYLRSYTEDAASADKIVHAACLCGRSTFALLADATQGCVQRTCTTCERSHLICDSADRWGAAHPAPVRCSCGHASYEVAVSFRHRDDGSVKWLTVGERCTHCGMLGSVANWKIDYEASDPDHFYALV